MHFFGGKKMKRTALALLVLILVKPAFAHEAWTIEGDHSAARFRIKHLMISTVAGEVMGLKGKVELDDKKIQTLEATLDAKTISTNNKKRDDHLRSPDFFDTAKYPNIAFKSKKVEEAGGKWKISGDLTLHGVTKEVTFESEGVTDAIKDPWGNTRRGLVATTKIDRNDFGIKWNKTLDAGGLALGNEVDITVETELVAPKAEAAPKKPKS
jgi:polyisoprenoid-binding protein YceI